MIRFKLNSIFEGGIERVVRCTGAKPGLETNKRLTFIPGKIYKCNDPLAIQYIKGEIGDCRETMVLTAALKENLAFHNVEYTVKKCGTCSSSKPKAFFNPFVIVEETNDN